MKSRPLVVDLVMLLVGVGTMATEGVEVDLEGELRRQYYRLAGNFCWYKFLYVLKCMSYFIIMPSVAIEGLIPGRYMYLV